MTRFNPPNLMQIFAYTEQVTPFPAAGQHIVINTQTAKWKTDLQRVINEIGDEEYIYLILVVEKQKPRITDQLFLIAKKGDINQEFFTCIKSKIEGTVESRETFQSFLTRNWEIDNTRYPLAFYFVTLEEDNATYIADRAVAPAFREKGLMKNISLAIIDVLSQKHGPDHKIRSLTIHQATYQFFNPDDKAGKRFAGLEFHEKTCQEIIDLHQKPAPTLRRR